MTTRDEFVVELRTWKGTPFHHLARLKGAGADCVGVIIGAMKNLNMEVEDMKWYPHQPINNVFGNAIRAQTTEIKIEDALPGDIMCFTLVTEEQHIAVITETVPYIKILHAYAPARKCVEHHFDEYWVSKMTYVGRLGAFL